MEEVLAGCVLESTLAAFREGCAESTCYDDLEGKSMTIHSLLVEKCAYVVGLLCENVMFTCHPVSPMFVHLSNLMPTYPFWKSKCMKFDGVRGEFEMSMVYIWQNTQHALWSLKKIYSPNRASACDSRCFRQNLTSIIKAGCGVECPSNRGSLSLPVTC